MSMHSRFRLCDQRSLPSLKTQVQLFRHESGATHVHFQNDDCHRAFCVGFRTTPEDSTGLPHILEHTVLCGSRRYPVRDPFFMMLRRSLQTFMNAMTYPDRTCYPFATQNLQDFDNLLGIYLDAVFEPLLKDLDFAQEGWRLEAEEDGNWAIKGVVYNEMKGAMADSDSLVAQACGELLFPHSCYRFNSGGDPAVIPSLRHEDLCAFHRRCYCAANACFTTWGALDLASIQQRFDSYCSRHPGQAMPIPSLQAPLPEALQCQVPVPLAAGQDARDVTITGLTWVWGDRVDLDQVLVGEMADQLLLGHAAAPLRLALEESQLGRSLSGSGFDASLRNCSFTVQMQGMDAQAQDAFEPLLWQNLERICAQGFSSDELHSALHQLELRRRRIGGDGLPLGLQKGLSALASWCYEGDILRTLDQDKALEDLRARALDQDFWKDFLSQHFLQHQHRLSVQVLPDTTFSARMLADEAERVSQIISAYDDQGQATLQMQAQDLAQQQQQAADSAVLPDLALSDVPEERPCSEGRWLKPGLCYFSAATGGLLYASVFFPLGTLDAESLTYLPTATAAVGRLGFAGHDYRDTARLLDACCGGVSAHLEYQALSGDRQQVRAALVCSVHGLAQRAEEWMPLLPRILRQQRFDEYARLRELLAMSLSGMNNALLHSGHVVAGSCAQRHFPGAAGLTHRLSGLGRREKLRQLVEAPESDLRDYADACAALLQRLLQARPVCALVSDRDQDPGLLALLEQSWQGWEWGSQQSFLQENIWRPPHLPQQEAQSLACLTATPVNFNALALPVVDRDHPQAAALAVACRYLTHTRLHRQIREQGGAYGAQASYQALSATVLLSSYRDPRLAATYEDLRSGLSWLQEAAIDAGQLKEAKLSLIAAIDSPLSPAGEALRRCSGDLLGNDPASINRFRQRILTCSGEEIHAAAQTYLRPEAASAACITNAERASAECPGWQTWQL